mgnify:CR=1 FL=1
MSGSGGQVGRAGRQGFTLIELLVAVTVFAVIAAAMFVALNEVLRSAAASRAELERLAALQRSLTIMGEDFRQAARRPSRDRFGDTMAALAVRNDSLHLTRSGYRSLADQRASNLRHIAYELDDDGQLLRHRWPRVDRSRESEPATQTMLNDVNDMTLRYRYEGEWLDQWPPSDQSEDEPWPRAISIRLDTEDYGAVNRTFTLP